MRIDSAPEVSAEQALRLVSIGADVLDVRDPWEWTAGHAPQALHVPPPATPPDRPDPAMDRSAGRCAVQER